MTFAGFAVNHLDIAPATPMCCGASPTPQARCRFATGDRPGGPNIVTFDPVTGAPLGPPTFDADTLTSYEIGSGPDSGPHFQHRCRGLPYRLERYVDLRPAQRTQQLYNSQGAKIDGGELTLTARPSRSFTVTGAFAYQNARLAAASADLGGAKGDPLPNVPEFTAALNADYRADGIGLKPTFGATLRFMSDRKAGFNGNPTLPQYDLGDYVTVDLRAGARFGPVNAQLFVRNLFDDRGAISAYTALASFGGPARVATLQPRTIGLSLTSRFQAKMGTAGGESRPPAARP